MSAKVLIIAGYGLNCEEETLFAFQHVGVDGKIVHINDLIENPKMMDEYQILAMPGGFSYGDDTGSGNGLAQKIRLSLWDDLTKFKERDTLMIGICNGCQIMANLGLVPAHGKRSVAVTYNANNRYQCRWVTVKANAENASPWLSGVDSLYIPVAHGEGRFMMSEETLAGLHADKQIAFQYAHGDELANGVFPHNPNGSTDDIAAITDDTGRVLAIMPHPERGMFSWQRDDYDVLKDGAQRRGEALPEEADGITLFKNAAKYFK